MRFKTDERRKKILGSEVQADESNSEPWTGELSNYFENF